jgi:hypothetical protein
LPAHGVRPPQRAPELAAAIDTLDLIDVSHVAQSNVPTAD